MEDQIIESSKTPRNTAKQDYADRLFSALVSSLTKNLQRGLENFLVSNHIKRKEIFLKFLEDNGYSLDTAKHLAIIERRTLRKQRTKARNEKIKTDRMAALPPKLPHEVYRNLLPDRWGSYHDTSWITDASDTKEIGCKRL